MVDECCSFLNYKNDNLQNDEQYSPEVFNIGLMCGIVEDSGIGFRPCPFVGYLNEVV